MIAPYLSSSLLSLFKPENKSQFIIIIDLNSTKLNDFLINTRVPVSLYGNMLTFRDTIKPCKLDGDYCKTMKNYKLNDDDSKLQDRKIIYGFGGEMKFDIKQKRRPSKRDRSLIRLLNSPVIMASGVSTVFLSSDPDGLCDRLKLLQQEKQFSYN